VSNKIIRALHVIACGDHVVLSSDADQMQQAAGSLQYILDTVPVEQDLKPYVACRGVDDAYLPVDLLTPMSPWPIAAHLAAHSGKVDHDFGHDRETNPGMTPRGEVVSNKRFRGGH
jgi:hypothetical protein